MTYLNSIMEMLDWNNPIEIQLKGRELAEGQIDLNELFQPKFQDKNIELWDNCALIISHKTDAELEPYLKKMFNWIQDLNWPGAECILQRLLSFQVNDVFMQGLTECMKKADASDDENWFYSLEKIYNNASLRDSDSFTDLIMAGEFEKASIQEDMHCSFVNRRLSAEAFLTNNITFYGFVQYMYYRTGERKWLELVIKMLSDTFWDLEGASNLILFYEKELDIGEYCNEEIYQRR